MDINATLRHVIDWCNGDRDERLEACHAAGEALWWMNQAGGFAPMEHLAVRFIEVWDGDTEDERGELDELARALRLLFKLDEHGAVTDWPHGWDLITS